MRGSVSAPDPQLSPHCHWPEDRARAVRCGSARWGPTGQEPSVGAAAHIFLANRIRLWIKILADKRRAGTNGMPVRHTHRHTPQTPIYCPRALFPRVIVHRQAHFSTVTERWLVLQPRLDTKRRVSFVGNQLLGEQCSWSDSERAVRLGLTIDVCIASNGNRI